VDGSTFKDIEKLEADLCRGIPEPEGICKGRRPTPLCDQVFAATFKIYSTVSSRRFACDLQDAHESGYLTALMNGVSMSAYLENPALTPIFQRLILESSLPLRAVETVFAPDSTGLSTSRFIRWYDEKYGTERSSHDWVKAHANCGTKTQIVTAVEIAGRDTGDCPMFKPLVETTAQNFNVREVPADKAYLSHEDLALLEKLGWTAFVPFESNNQPGEVGSLWEKMYAYYTFRREDFLKHYHARSNAEWAFSMIKAKFRNHLRSRTDIAMKNEVLAKFPCHNLCVVHLSHVELGIEPVFWNDQPASDAPVTISFGRTV
jgi:transposase